MCGICGVIAFGETTLNPNDFKSMTDSIAHRGPDGAGYLVAQFSKKTLLFTDETFRSTYLSLPTIDSRNGKQQLQQESWDIFLGHRRLSILDTSSAGFQPMNNRTQDVFVTYNGEIYNFKEIRTELIKLGYSFITRTDTEVIIYAYETWGIDFIHRLNGMFAIALWDKKRNLFFLIRDRYGIKPLYYTLLTTGEFIFASEIKSILKYKTYQKTLDYEALLEYFTFQNILTDKTLYKSIKLLPAGHYMMLNLNSANPAIQPHLYWDFDFTSPHQIKTEEEYTEELQRLFTKAVKRQLVSDVEVGSYLSGGMDSGSITAIAAKKIPHLKTFTLGFDLHNVAEFENGLDERKKAEYLSYLFKTEHYEMVLKSSDMEHCLKTLTWHLEEPRVGQSYPNYYASKLASKFVKVVLAGTGGDELFGGYPWRYSNISLNNGFDDYIDKYYLFWQRLLNHSQLKKLFLPMTNEISHVATRDIFYQFFANKNKTNLHSVDYINHSFYFEIKTFLHGLLIVEDKLSMAHSLETRVPFLDNDLVDFAMKLPVQFKLGNLKENASQGKIIFRKSLLNLLPADYIYATKQGFSSPDYSWFKGDSLQYIKNKLLKNTANIYKYFDVNTVKDIIQQHLEGNENLRLFIWSLLNFEHWCEHYA